METSQTLAEEAVVSQHFTLRYVIFTHLIPPPPSLTISFQHILQPEVLSS